MTFAKTLRQLRKEQGISQEELAQSICVSKGTVSVWERGQRLPEMGTVDRLCSFFHVSRGRLIGALPETKEVETWEKFNTLPGKTKALIAELIDKAYEMEKEEHEG